MSLNDFAMASRTRMKPQAGFSLLEVLVALLVISISLLGVAGMQAISISNAGESGFRSIAATQASSLASEMATNWEYWQPQNGTYPAAITVNGAAVTLGGAAQAIPTCTAWGSGQVCNNSQMALYDLSQWGIQLQKNLPGGTGTVTCGLVALVNCQIKVSWIEKNLSQNQSTTAATANSGTTYHLAMMVQP